MSFVDVDESNFTFGFLVSLPSLLRNELFLPPPGLSQGAFSPFFLEALLLLVALLDLLGGKRAMRLLALVAVGAAIPAIRIAR